MAVTREGIPKSTLMSVEHFIKNVSTNPIQRDTETHAVKANSPGHHLHEYHPTHLRVSIAELPNGKQYKLDGHTRALLWDEKKLDIPHGQKLLVDVYQVADKEELMSHYLCFDNSSSAENTNDKLYGALRGLNFRPNNRASFYRNIGLSAAIKALVFEAKWGQASHLNTMVLLKPWIPTLRLIDNVPLYNAVRFPSPFTAAMLMSVRYYGKSVLSFWQDHHNDAGLKHSKTVNGVYMANEVLLAFKNPIDPKRKKKRGERINYYLPRVLRCVDYYMQEKRFPISVGPGGSHWKDMPTSREWWEESIGKHDHPEMRSQAKVVDDG